MKNDKMKEIVGETFEDLSIAEMAMVQGSGDVDVEATPAVLISVSKVVISGLGTFASAVQVVKTIKGSC